MERPARRDIVHAERYAQLNEIKGVHVVLEYESFSDGNGDGHNQPYLQAFYTDLTGQRFKAIITDTISTRIQGDSKSFGVENDACAKGFEPMLLNMNLC